MDQDAPRVGGPAAFDEPASIALWLPELRARKNEIYSPGHFCVYLTEGAKEDRADISAQWLRSEQRPLGPTPLEAVFITYRAPDDQTGDWDHWAGVISDHLTRAGAWPDDCWVERVLIVRARARTDDQVGTWVFAWERNDNEAQEETP